MLIYPYLLIKNRLINQVSDITCYWYKDQDLKKTRGALRSQHQVLIRFDNPDIEQLGCDVQGANLSFAVMLVTDTAYDDQDKRLTQTGHPEKAENIYKALSGYFANLSALPDFSNLAGTDDDYRILNSIRRTQYRPDHNMSNLIITDQQFTCYMKDYSAVDEFQEVTKGLEITNFDVL